MAPLNLRDGDEQSASPHEPGRSAQGIAGTRLFSASRRNVISANEANHIAGRNRGLFELSSMLKRLPMRPVPALTIAGSESMRSASLTPTLRMR